MTIEDLLSHLDGVKRRGNRWSAKCPAHGDKSPSLSVSEGERGLLIRCWVGCTLDEICSSLHLQKQDLFYDRLDTDPRKRKAAALERDRQRQAQAAVARKQGRRIDARRAAEEFLNSCQGLDISGWSDDRLDRELNLLADAYVLLEEECGSWAR